MRAILTNVGTRGDFQPLCALAQEAECRGHCPKFAVPQFAINIVNDFGFESCSLCGDISSLRDEVNRHWNRDSNTYNDPSKARDLLAPFESYFPTAFEKLVDACRHADVLISGPAQPLARMVHEYTGIPFVSVQTSHFGGTGSPGVDIAGDLLVNNFRRKLGLAEVRHAFITGANSSQLSLYTVSPALSERTRIGPHIVISPGSGLHAWNQK